MTILQQDSSVRSQIRPSVWAGYTLPRSVIMGEELPSKDLISTKENVPQEWLNEMVFTFQNGSFADFLEKYLGLTLNARNHEQILLKANKILKEGVPELVNTDDPLIMLEAIDIAHNADEYGHHLFQTACFLKEKNQLPKECRFMFWRKINPALYEEKELFETVERALLEPTKKIPHQWAQNDFYKWLRTDDSKEYLAQMQRMAALELVLANNGIMPIDRAVRNYVHEHHVPAYQRRQRPRRRSWRVYGE